MAGRRPTPTALKRAQGNPGKRKLRDDEPTATTGTTAPKCLGRVGRNEWSRVMKATKELGTITKLDRGELTIYCKAWENFCAAVDIYTADGLVVVAPNGTMKRHPAVDIANSAAKLMDSTAKELGFTPAARSKVPGKPKEEKDTFQDFLNSGGIKAVK